jgi:hypothetical protein
LKDKKLEGIKGVGNRLQAAGALPMMQPPSSKPQRGPTRDGGSCRKT